MTEWLRSRSAKPYTRVRFSLPPRTACNFKPPIADLSPGFLNLAAPSDSERGCVEIVKLREQLGKEPDFAGNLPARPDWDTYFIQVAFAIAERADCTRMKVGAVITDKDHRIMATGYNGAPAGSPGCLEGACPRGRHYTVRIHPEDYAFPEDHELACACGSALPCSKSAKPGEGSYDDCISIHAEANAIVYAGRDRCIGSTLYCTYAPCVNCVKLIKAAAIIRVVIP